MRLAGTACGGRPGAHGTGWRAAAVVGQGVVRGDRPPDTSPYGPERPADIADAGGEMQAGLALEQVRAGLLELDGFDGAAELADRIEVGQVQANQAEAAASGIDEVVAKGVADPAGLIEEVVNRVDARLTDAETRTEETLAALSGAFAALESRVARSEGGLGPEIEARIDQYTANALAHGAVLEAAE